MVTSSSLYVLAVVQRQRTEQKIATPDDLCKPETTYFDGGENYGLALLKPDAFSLSLSFPTQCSCKSLPFNEVMWYKKKGRKEGRKGGRKEVHKAKDDKILINNAKVMLLELLQSSEDIW